MRRKSRPQKARRWRRRLAWSVVLFPVAIWLLGNLFFATPLGLGLVERRVEKKLGLKCEIDRISWTPWSGAVIKKIVLSSPEDFPAECQVAVVEAVIVDPTWKDLLRKRISFQLLDVEGVEVNIPVELIKHLARKHQGQPVILQEQAQPVAVEVELEKEEETTKEKPMELDSPESEEKPAPVVAQKEIKSEEAKIILKGASVRLFSLQVPEWEFAVSDLSADFLLGGAPEDGEIKVGEVSVGGGELMRDLTLPLKWSGQVLTMPEQSLEARGLKFSIAGAMRPVPGIPYGLRLQVPEQSMDLAEVMQIDVPVSVGRFSGAHRLDGYVLRPELVYGSSRSIFREVVVRDAKDQSPVEFEWGLVDLRLSPAGLVAPDFRWVGEEDAVLGNGFITAGGEGVAVVRLVGSAERAEVYERRAREWRDGFSLQMKPLFTPDRWYSDVRFDLSAEGLMVGLEEENIQNIVP